MKCLNCQKDIPDNVRFCGFCGTKVEPDKLHNEPEEKDISDQAKFEEKQSETVAQSEQELISEEIEATPDTSIKSSGKDEPEKDELIEIESETNDVESETAHEKISEDSLPDKTKLGRHSNEIIEEQTNKKDEQFINPKEPETGEPGNEPSNVIVDDVEYKKTELSSIDSVSIAEDDAMQVKEATLKHPDNAINSDNDKSPPDNIKQESSSQKSKPEKPEDEHLIKEQYKDPERQETIKTSELKDFGNQPNKKNKVEDKLLQVDPIISDENVEFSEDLMKEKILKNDSEENNVADDLEKVSIDEIPDKKDHPEVMKGAGFDKGLTKSSNFSEQRKKIRSSSPSTRKKIIISVSIIAFLFIATFTLIYIFSGTSKEENHWSQASNLDNKAAYETYLELYPMGEHVFEATARLAELNKQSLNEMINIKGEKDLADSLKNMRQQARLDSITNVNQQKLLDKIEALQKQTNQESSGIIEQQKLLDSIEKLQKQAEKEQLIAEAKRDSLILVMNERGKSQNNQNDQKVKPVIVKEDENKIYDYVPIMPSFPGGDTEMLKFIANNTKYPVSASENSIEGVIFISAIVEKNGKLTNLSVLRSLGYGCDEAAKETVRKMPFWTPGKKDGKNVRTKVSISISFKLY